MLPIRRLVFIPLPSPAGAAVNSRGILGHTEKEGGTGVSGEMVNPADEDAGRNGSPRLILVDRHLVGSRGRHVISNAERKEVTAG